MGITCPDIVKKEPSISETVILDLRTSLVSLSRKEAKNIHFRNEHEHDYVITFEVNFSFVT